MLISLWKTVFPYKILVNLLWMNFFISFVIIILVINMNISNINFKKKIGMRTIKTALAVVIGLYLSMLLNLNTPIFTSIATISTMKSSFSESFIDVKKRLFTSIFGVILGSILGMFKTHQLLNPIIAGLGIIIIIYILQATNVKDMTVLSCVVFMASFISDSKLIYGFDRVLGTFLGVVISVSINYLIATPNVYEHFINNSRDTLKKSKNFMLQLIMNEEHSISEFEESFANTKKSYELLISELDTPIHARFDFYKAERIMELFTDFNNRFQLLNSIDSRPDMTSDNCNLIEDIFFIKLLENGKLKGDLNTIYNYHLHKILLNLSIVEKLIGDNK
ncbi:hypothetical protein HMPREF0629_00416 [Peptoniphilus sp. oral taxon 386 str. F0131]|nr:hypothetical protein HMPREF0629_00416 [Peptoniphilus sp. oral taxon 386 str. F0131]